jgi:raffinose/stachyose/melibiose transport system permease protein
VSFLRYRPRTFGLELLMIAVGLLFLFPVYVLVNLSLKSPAEISEAALGLPHHVQLSNYSKAWTGATLGAAFVNSTIITVAGLVLLILVGSFASYYLARARTRLSYGMYILFLVGIILPFQLALVPLYKMMKDAGLLGSYTSMVAFYTGLQMPFTIFLYTGFLRALPREYGEAALVDGASHLQSFTRVTFPLLRPITGTVIILNAVFIWNDFLTPLIYLGGSSNETLPVVVYQFVGQYVSSWGLVFAAVVLATLPMLVLFVALQRFVIRGFSSGLKG